MNIFNNPLGALTSSEDFSQTPLINEFISPIFEIHIHFYHTLCNIFFSFAQTSI